MLTRVHHHKVAAVPDGVWLSVDTLERVNQQMGVEAGEFLVSFAAPPAAEEGELLVVTADGKGLPRPARQK